MVRSDFATSHIAPISFSAAADAWANARPIEPHINANASVFAHPCMGIVKRERRSGSKLLVPHAPIEGVDQGPMSVISFLGIVSLFDLGPFLRPDPRVSPRRRAQLQSRLAVAVS